MQQLIPVLMKGTKSNQANPQSGRKKKEFINTTGIVQKTHSKGTKSVDINQKTTENMKRELT
jgi:hypothetical protein